MDSYAEACRIATIYGLRKGDVDWALREAIAHVRGNSTGRMSRERALEAGVALLEEWLRDGDSWVLDIHNPSDVADFLVKRSSVCAWAVIQAKIRSDVG